MNVFEQLIGSDSGKAAPVPPQLEEFFGHESVQGSSNDQESPLTKGIKEGFDYLAKMEDGSESNPGLAIWLYESVSGMELPSTAKTLLDGATISKHGNRVKISRDGQVRLDLNQSLLDGKIKIQSLDFGSTSFDLSGNADSPRLKNIEGLSLAVEIGGSNLTIDIRDMSLSKGNDGKPVLKVEIEHPVPLRERIALGLPARIPLTLELGSDGMPKGMKVSDALNSAADALGYGITGLTFGETLRQAAREAKFNEDHPECSSGPAESLLPRLSVRDTDFEQYLQTGLHVLKTLPDGFELDPRALLSGYESLSGQTLSGTAGELLDGVTNISKHGDRIEFSRNRDATIAVNKELLGGALKIKSLNLGSTGFDLTRDSGVLRLSNLTGFSLTTEIAGMERTIAIKDLALRKGDNGELLLDTEVENPVPFYVGWFHGLPRRIPISLELNPDGEVEGMKISDALNTSAEMVGWPGLKVAAGAAEIVEKHPELARQAINNAFPVPALILSGEADAHSLAELAMRANPVYATYKTVDFVVENRDEVLDVAGDVAKLAFKASPAGMAYSLFFGD